MRSRQQWIYMLFFFLYNKISQKKMADAPDTNWMNWFCRHFFFKTFSDRNKRLEIEKCQLFLFFLVKFRIKWDRLALAVVNRSLSGVRLENMQYLGMTEDVSNLSTAHWTPLSGLAYLGQSHIKAGLSFYFRELRMSRRRFAAFIKTC